MTAARHIVLKDSPDLILADYLQLIDPPRKTSYQDRDVEDVIKPLKWLAKDTRIAVAVASQLNRAKERRQDKRPILADLRSGGNQEAHCDKALLIDNEPPTDREEKDSHLPRSATIYVAKHRNGPTGRASVMFEPTCALFASQSYYTASGVEQ